MDIRTFRQTLNIENKSKGIRQSKTDHHTSLMSHKIIPSVDYNYWLKRLDTQLNEPANQN